MIWVGRVLVEECGGSEVLQKEAPVCPAGALTMSHFSLVSPRSHGHNAPLNSPAGRPRDAATTCFFNIQQKLKYLCGFAHTQTHTHKCSPSCTPMHNPIHTCTRTQTRLFGIMHAVAHTHQHADFACICTHSPPKINT